jgi:UDP-N-acetylglucosamine--N-acetylmuramyl-(pentapeptide) pyrophosphoryl-undecaprenol N-acetylglucosamine transferase
MRILFTGGGTGGHITPIIAVAREIKKIQETEMYFLGAKAPQGLVDALQKEEIKTKFIIAGKFRRYFSFKFFIDLIKIPLGLIQSFWYLFIWMPDVIFNKGGYGSLPAVLVGWLYRIPVITHESDSIPGIATRLGGKFSKRIAVSFAKAESFFSDKKTALTGNPVRNLCSEKKESTKPVVLVLGGSQGADPIDQVILAILPQLFGKYEIIHQCRKENYEDIKKQTEAIEGYRVQPFFSEEELKNVFASANLVVSRAGAGSIFEIALCGKPSILIPLPDSAADHQRENAFTYAEAGATIVIEQVNLTPNILLNEIEKIVNNQRLMDKMSQNALSFAIPEAGKRIAEEIIKLGI